jgi:hypothetical protein
MSIPSACAVIRLVLLVVWCRQAGCVNAGGVNAGVRTRAWRRGRQGALRPFVLWFGAGVMTCVSDARCGGFHSLGERCCRLIDPPVWRRGRVGAFTWRTRRNNAVPDGLAAILAATKGRKRKRRFTTTLHAPATTGAFTWRTRRNNAVPDGLCGDFGGHQGQKAQAPLHDHTPCSSDNRSIGCNRLCSSLRPPSQPRV